MSLSARARQFFMFSIWGSNQSQLQPFCRNPAHTQRLWTGVWCYFPGWANCLWGSVLSLSLSGCCRTLHCYTMQPWIPGNALMKTYEKLDVSWLWREGCREDTERWKMGVKQKRVRSEAWEGGTEHAVRQKDGWMEGKLAGVAVRETQYWLKAVQTKSLLKLSGFPSCVHYTHFICSVMCL